jgi:hypothetical protein
MSRLASALDRRKHIVNQFEEIVGSRPNLLRPRTFNEKIQWLKLYHHDPLMTRVTDKYAMRGYVEETVGAGHTVPLLGAWDDPAAIDFEALPDQFVLKVTGGYGMNIFCNDRSEFDRDAARATLSAWLQPARNHYFYSYEWAYKDISSRVVAEPLIDLPGLVTDFKLFCFSGVPHSFMVTTELTKDDILIDLFTLDWEWQEYPNPLRAHHPVPPEEPRQLERMIEYGSLLSRPFPAARIDFIEASDELFVGEITLYSGNGMTPSVDPVRQHEMGSRIQLPLRSWPRALAIETAARVLAR